jgi:hypothetical protein
MPLAREHNIPDNDQAPLVAEDFQCKVDWAAGLKVFHVKIILFCNWLFFAIIVYICNQLLFTIGTKLVINRHKLNVAHHQ